MTVFSLGGDVYAISGDFEFVRGFLAHLPLF